MAQTRISHKTTHSAKSARRGVLPSLEHEGCRLGEHRDTVSECGWCRPRTSSPSDPPKWRPGQARMLVLSVSPWGFLPSGGGCYCLQASPVTAPIACPSAQPPPPPSPSEGATRDMGGGVRPGGSTSPPSSPVPVRPGAHSQLSNSLRARRAAGSEGRRSGPFLRGVHRLRARSQGPGRSSRRAVLAGQSAVPGPPHLPPAAAPSSPGLVLTPPTAASTESAMSLRGQTSGALPGRGWAQAGGGARWAGITLTGLGRGLGRGQALGRAHLAHKVLVS